MKRHCTAACITGMVLYVGLISPLLECSAHDNCHIHYDEPARSISSQQSPSHLNYSVSASASTATGSIQSFRASPSFEVPEEY